MTSSLPASAIDWFEIPAVDIDRASRFYEVLLGHPLRRERIAGSELAVFACEGPAGKGCLMAGESAPRPSADGSIVYLHAGAALDPVLSRLEAAGGRLALPKVVLPGEMGCYAHVIDTEGNRVGLHAAR